MKEYAPLALRIGLGGLFVTTGIIKLTNPAMVQGILSAIGFPAAVFWTWLLTFAELICGTAVLVGFKLKYSTVPLGIVLFVAIVAHPLGLLDALKDSALLTGLVSLWLGSPGAWSLSRK